MFVVIVSLIVIHLYSLSPMSGVRQGIGVLLKEARSIEQDKEIDIEKLTLEISDEVSVDLVDENNFSPKDSQEAFQELDKLRKVLLIEQKDNQESLEKLYRQIEEIDASRESLLIDIKEGQKTLRKFEKSEEVLLIEREDNQESLQKLYRQIKEIEELREPLVVELSARQSANFNLSDQLGQIESQIASLLIQLEQAPKESFSDISQNSDVNAPEGLENQHLIDRVAHFKDILGAQNVVWVSPDTVDSIRQEAIEQGLLIPIENGSYIHRSDPSDTQRDRAITQIHGSTPATKAGHYLGNYIQSSSDALIDKVKGSMEDKKMYVVAGRLGSKDLSRNDLVAFVTDNPYIALSSTYLNDIDPFAFNDLEKESDYFVGIHSSKKAFDEKGERTQKGVHHHTDFTEEYPRGIAVSYGSSYGGNAILFKKVFGLRMTNAFAIDQAKKDPNVWFSYEHMALLQVTSPEGKEYTFAAAFPSACGKSNLAMINLQESMTSQGWKVEVLGDDLVRLKKGEDGRMYVQATEKGYFPVLKGTNQKTNLRAMKTYEEGDVVYTNVFLCDESSPKDQLEVWWPGKDELDGVPYSSGVTWKGERWEKGSDNHLQKDEKGELVLKDGQPVVKENFFAHKNCRGCLKNTNSDNLSDYERRGEWVPLDFILHGGRDDDDALLRIFDDWEEGVLEGFFNISQTTIAEAGKEGLPKSEPYAMEPFFGASLADYVEHHLKAKDRFKELPLIAHVNWFLKDDEGKFVWPGFDFNSFVLKYLIDYKEGRVQARTSSDVLGKSPQLEDMFIDEVPSKISQKDLEVVLKGHSYSAAQKHLRDLVLFDKYNTLNVLYGKGFYPEVLRKKLDERTEQLKEEIINFLIDFDKKFHINNKDSIPEMTILSVYKAIEICQNLGILKDQCERLLLHYCSLLPIPKTAEVSTFFDFKLYVNQCVERKYFPVLKAFLYTNEKFSPSSEIQAIAADMIKLFDSEEEELTDALPQICGRIKKMDLKMRSRIKKMDWRNRETEEKEEEEMEFAIDQETEEEEEEEEMDFAIDRESEQKCSQKLPQMQIQKERSKEKLNFTKLEMKEKKQSLGFPRPPHSKRTKIESLSMFQARSTLKTVKEKIKNQDQAYLDKKKKSELTQYTVEQLLLRKSVQSFQSQLQVNIVYQDGVVSQSNLAKTGDYNVVATNTIDELEGGGYQVNIIIDESILDMAILANLSPVEYELFIDFILLNELIQATYSIDQKDIHRQRMLPLDILKLEFGSQISALLTVSKLHSLDAVKLVHTVIGKIILAGQDYYYDVDSSSTQDSSLEEAGLAREEEKVAKTIERMNWDQVLEMIEKLGQEVCSKESVLSYKSLEQEISSKGLESDFSSYSQNSRTLLSAA